MAGVIGRVMGQRADRNAYSLTPFAFRIKDSTKSPART
jgi:hypothetical protein